MKLRTLLAAIILSGLIIAAGCKSSDMKKDAEKIGDAMCRNLELSGKLRTINPNDTASLAKLQAQSNKLQEEMNKLYSDFKDKWGEKVKDKEFSKKFSDELRRAMLNCPHLSKEDREQFQRDLGK